MHTPPTTSPPQAPSHDEDDRQVGAHGDDIGDIEDRDIEGDDIDDTEEGDEDESDDLADDDLADDDDGNDEADEADDDGNDEADDDGNDEADDEDDDDDDDQEAAAEAAEAADVDKIAKEAETEWRLHEMGARARAVSAGHDHARAATGELIRLQRETIKTVRAVDAGARRNARTQRQFATLNARINNRMAASTIAHADMIFAAIKAQRRHMMAEPPPRTSGAEIAGRLGEKFLEQVGTVAAAVFGGQGSDILNLLQGLTGDLSPAPAGAKAAAGAGAGGAAGKAPAPSAGGAAGKAPAPGAGGAAGKAPAPGAGGAAGKAPAPTSAESAETIKALAVLLDHLPADLDGQSLGDLRQWLRKGA